MVRGGAKTSHASLASHTGEGGALPREVARGRWRHPARWRRWRHPKWGHPKIEVAPHQVCATPNMAVAQDHQWAQKQSPSIAFQNQIPIFLPPRPNASFSHWVGETMVWLGENWNFGCGMPSTAIIKKMGWRHITRLRILRG